MKTMRPQILFCFVLAALMQGCSTTRSPDELLQRARQLYGEPQTPHECTVYGETKKTGHIRLAEGTTLTQFISQCNGFTPYANRKRITIARGKEKTKHNWFRIDEGKEEDPVIKPGDVILVPLLSAGLW